MSLLRPLLRHIPTATPVPHRAILSVTGSQASEFLNGVLAFSVKDPKKPLYSTFLHAQGKVLYDVFMYTDTDTEGQQGYLIEYDSRAPSLLQLLKRYVLRAKVKIRDASEEYDVWASWGSEKERHWETPRHWTIARSGVIEPLWDNTTEWPWGSQDRLIHDRRAVGMGNRMLVRKGDSPQETATHDTAPGDAYTLHRILHGVPEGVTDIPSTAFPMESNLDIMGGLDFRKGCYVGQELTVRTYHTGILRKRILPVAIHKPNEPPSEAVSPNPDSPSLPSGLQITESQTPNVDGSTRRPRKTGTLLSSTQGVGLALLRYSAFGRAQGDRKLVFGVPNEDGTETMWGLSYWWPDWWLQN